MTLITCKLDLTSKICSTSAIIISATLITASIYLQNQLSVILFISAILLVIPLLFSPRSISLINDKIQIKMPLWSRYIPLDEYHRADANKFPLRQSIKLISSFGIGGHLGLHYYRGIGIYKGCFTDYKRVTILRNKKTKKFIVVNNINTLLDNYYK